MKIIKLNDTDKLKNEMKKYTEMGIKSFEEKMNQFVLQGYHYTKVYDIKNITEKGIIALSEETLNVIKNNIKRKYSNESDYIEEQFQKYQKEKFRENNTGHISFCTNENQAMNNTQDILKFYGGEAIENYFKNNNIMYSKLQEIGIPVIIEFNFKYEELSKSTKKKLKKLLEEIEKSDEKSIRDKKKLLDTLELRIENNIDANMIQGYYSLDKENLNIQKFIKIR